MDENQQPEIERIFRIDLYPMEWLVLTGHMTPAERGIFMTVVCLIYAKRGRIHYDEKTIKQISGLSNCSSRFARVTVDNLVHKHGDLQISDGKIGQKRAENELNKKRTHLENSAKGGRNKAENDRVYNEINNIGSSGTRNSLSTPSPSPSPSDKDSIDGTLKKISVSQTALERAKPLAPGWDVYSLEKTFLAWLAGREWPANIDAAFVSWVRKFTKGKRP